MIAQKYALRAEMKDNELELRKMELEFQKKTFKAKEAERRACVELEREERRAILSILKNHVDN